MITLLSRECYAASLDMFPPKGCLVVIFSTEVDPNQPSKITQIFIREIALENKYHFNDKRKMITTTNN